MSGDPERATDPARPDAPPAAAPTDIPKAVDVAAQAPQRVIEGRIESVTEENAAEPEAPAAMRWYVSTLTVVNLSHVCCLIAFPLVIVLGGLVAMCVVLAAGAGSFLRIW